MLGTNNLVSIFERKTIAKVGYCSSFVSDLEVVIMRCQTDYLMTCQARFIRIILFGYSVFDFCDGFIHWQNSFLTPRPPTTRQASYSVLTFQLLHCFVFVTTSGFLKDFRLLPLSFARQVLALERQVVLEKSIIKAIVAYWFSSKQTAAN